MNRQWSTVSHPAVDFQAGDRWDQFLEETYVCPQCGRLSMLHSTCPDCFSGMMPLWKKAFSKIVRWEWKSRLLSVALLCTAMYVWLSCGFGWIGNAFAGLIFLVSVWQEVKLFSQRVRAGENNLYYAVIKFQHEWPAFQRRMDESCSFQSLEQTRDAYYADLLWLHKESEALQEGDVLHRDELYAHALRLSRVCDCLQLAKIRFHLLCMADLCEGVYTDIEQIAKMFLFAPQKNLTGEGFVVEEGNGVCTLCSCIRLDPMGAMKEYGVKLCVLLLARCWQNMIDLTEEETWDLCRTVAYCGPQKVNVVAHATKTLMESEYFERICAMEPEFLTFVGREAQG